MNDIRWDFAANDVALSGGDFDVTHTCSTQNAALIFNKSAASLTNPYFGVGFEEFYPHLPEWMWGSVESLGEKEIKDDGASIVRLRIVRGEDGITSSAEIFARYRGE